LSRAITIDELAAGSTLEVIPSLDRLHAADDCLTIDEHLIAGWTQQLRGWRFRR
jgi:hypothetical protein